MSNAIFEATYFASQQITATFDMVWAVDAGLWNLRQDVQRYFIEHPDANNIEVKNALVSGLNIHGLNPKRIANELSWEYQEQYIAELLLLNAIAIFDTWVDSFIDSTILLQSNNQIKKIKADMKIGEFSSFDSAISAESASSLAGCFRFSAQKQDAHINNLRLVYKYFKSCRNCCSHGNHQFTNIAETNYEAIKSLTNASCGLKEFPKIVMTKQGDPLVLILRGVVGFYDVLNRIINHYDLVAAEKTGIENELIKRWGTAPNVKKFLSENRRNIYIRNYMNSIHMCPPYVAKTTDVYNFLVAKHAI